jgi:DNA-binding transcriptional LysR family regulator
MDISALSIFVEVIRRGSFAAVAKDRNVDPSSISRLIAGLEDELGIRLFQRSTRQLSPTEEGRIYFERIEPLIEELEHARAAAQDAGAGLSGTLRLSTTIAFGQLCIVPLLAEFRANHPGLALELVLTDTNLDLIAERIDVAIRLGPRLDLHRRCLENCQAKHLCDEVLGRVGIRSRSPRSNAGAPIVMRRRIRPACSRAAVLPLNAPRSSPACAPALRASGSCRRRRAPADR